MAEITKMAIIAIMEYYELASNMVYMGVFLGSMLPQYMALCVS